MNKIKNYEEACKITGQDPTKEISKQDRLETMIKAINNNEPAEWHNPDKSNHYPIFHIVKDHSKPSGFGLSYYDCGTTSAHAVVGSRLTFRSFDGMKHMVEDHIEYYEEVYL